MRSAYLVLGVPGNASDEDIEFAFARAKNLYTPARLASTEGAAEKFTEVKDAYNILRNAESRAAHDRKLTSERQPRPATRPVVIIQEESPTRKLIVYVMILAAAVLGGGFFISYKNAEARKQQAMLELASKAQAAKEQELQRIEVERAQADAARAKAKAEADDRRFSAEGRMAAARADAERHRSEQNALQMQRMAVAEAQRQEANQRTEQRRIESEARLRLEADKRRIRELCYQNYRRYDC
jgi:curved DNA-binding protein CbpA